MPGFLDHDARCLVETWFGIAVQLLGDRNWFDLGGWLRLWLGGGRDFVAVAACCRAFGASLSPRCHLCGVTWIFQGWWCYSHHQTVYDRQTLVQANTCRPCSYRLPYVSIGRDGTGGPPVTVGPLGDDQFALREVPSWSRLCSRCGIMFNDDWVHRRYICSHTAREWSEVSSEWSFTDPGGSSDDDRTPAWLLDPVAAGIRARYFERLYASQQIAPQPASQARPSAAPGIGGAAQPR